MSPEAALLARALRDGRALASVIGVPDASLEAARDLARWAAAIGEPQLALAVWDGCAALDDAAPSWLGLAEVALAAGEAGRAFEAAAQARDRAGITDRDRAALVSARACLLGGRVAEARAWLHTISGDADNDVAQLARAIEASLEARAVQAR